MVPGITLQSTNLLPEQRLVRFGHYQSREQAAKMSGSGNIAYLLTPFMLFCAEHRGSVQKENPGRTDAELGGTRLVPPCPHPPAA
jgi:hypothetical protein